MALTTDFQIIRDIDRRLASLQNIQDREVWGLRTDLKLFIQETRHYRTGILERLEKLEEKAVRPVIDLQSMQALIQNLWFKLAVLLALATGNTKLIDLVSAAFQR
jgi:hypothetical protein